MDKRVEELVEKVAEMLAGMYGRSMEANKRQAKQILFNNNLAMVTHQFLNVFSTKQDKLARVIPLTEVIKKAMAEHSKPSGLPKDWTGRVLKEATFDGNYHCSHCGKTFRIAEQAEFLKHQRSCTEGEMPMLEGIELSETIQHFPYWDINRSNKFIEELCGYVAKAAQDNVKPWCAAREAKAFEKGVHHGTTVRNNNWCSDNHKRHGEKMREAVKQARKEVAKEIIKWGEETCPHDLFGEGTQCFKHACDECWQELKAHYTKSPSGVEEKEHDG